MQSFEKFLTRLKNITSTEMDREKGDVITKAPLPPTISHPDWAVIDRKVIDTLKKDTSGKYVSVRIYSANDSFESFKDIALSVNLFLNAFGFEVEAVEEPKKGSWSQNILAKAVRFMAKKETHERLKKAERAIEIQLLSKHEGELDLNQAKAASMLLKSLSKEKNVVVQMGRLLIIKSERPGANIVVKGLIDKELEFIEKNPVLLASSDEMFDALISSPNKLIGKVETEPYIREGLATPAPSIKCWLTTWGCSADLLFCYPDRQLLADCVSSTWCLSRQKQIRAWPSGSFRGLLPRAAPGHERPFTATQPDVRATIDSGHSEATPLTSRPYLTSPKREHNPSSIGLLFHNVTTGPVA